MPRETKPTFLVLLFVLIGLILQAVFAFSPAHAQTANGESKPPAGKFLARLKATLPNYRGPSEIKSTPAVLVFSPHQTVIAIRTADKVVSLHETATGKLIASLTDPKRAIDAFAFSPDGSLAATRHIPDKSVRLWDSATGKLIHTLPGHAEVGFFDKNANSRSVVERKEILPVAFSPDGKRVLTEQDNDIYSVYDTATGELKVKLHHGTKTSKMKNVFANFFFMRSTLEAAVGMYGETTFSPDGRLIVTVDRDKYPKLWDAATGELRATLEAHGSEVYGVLFSPNSRMLITLSVTGTMKLWDTETGSLRYSLGDGKKKFLGAIWDPTGETIALWSPTNKEVSIIKAADGQIKLKVTEKGVRRIAFSPNGMVIATAGGDKNAAKVWDVSTGSLKFALPKGEDDTQMILWSPDGRIFVTSNDEAATLWDAESGELIQRLGERARYPIRFNSDGRTLATGSKNDVALLWEIEEK